MSVAEESLTGPGYRSPLEAMTTGPRERYLFVTCVRGGPHHRSKGDGDYLATVDVDPNSSTYGTVIDRLVMPALADELHHSGWNTCSSCHGERDKCRNRLILPCLNSDRIYIVKIDRQSNGTYQTSLEQSIEPSSLHQLGVSAPHTSHCLPNGKLMISTLGDGATGGAQGNLLLVECATTTTTCCASSVANFKPIGLWNKQPVPFGYDFWYQPQHDVLVSTEWGAPNRFRAGFNANDLAEKQYGSTIHFWRWTTGELKQSIDLQDIAPGTMMPLEVRFLHRPNAAEGYVGCALSGNIFRFYKVMSSTSSGDAAAAAANEWGKWTADEVIRIPAKQVSGWSATELPALITDILISLDDRFLYASAWAFGEVRQYHIEGDHCHSPQLTGIVRVGGLLLTNPLIKMLHDPEVNLLGEKQIADKINTTTLRGGAQMLQLSLDGKRLYVTNSLHSAWDAQFYPEMVQKGSQLVKIDVMNNTGEQQTGNTSAGIQIDRTFVVDFGAEPNGPVLAHEMRYPGGDCTSDIWI